MRGLTEYERGGLDRRFNLADGHAYQGMSSLLPGALDDLGEIWAMCETTSVPELERRFRSACAQLSVAPAMDEIDSYNICPTASNSVELVAAAMVARGLAVRLIEPTFDNLALILRRRGVPLVPLPETLLHGIDTVADAMRVLAHDGCGALMLVQPNNPTGRTLDERRFRRIVEACVLTDTVLLLDNSFRFYNTVGFDDYAILRDSGVSFVAFEDTGKVWPTHDMKASLLFTSPDLAALMQELYNEVYLCHSRFALAILERCLAETKRRGLGATIWRQVRERRALLHRMLRGTVIEASPEATGSTLSVEWLRCDRTGMTDVELCDMMAAAGLQVLPGRHFFWASPEWPSHQRHIRVAMMKPMHQFESSVGLLCRFADRFTADQPPPLPLAAGGRGG